MYYNYGYDWFRVAGAGHQVAWGVHHFDIVLWAMGVKSPETVFATGGNFAFETITTIRTPSTPRSSSAPVRWPSTASFCTTRCGPATAARRARTARLHRHLRIHGARPRGLLDRQGAVPGSQVQCGGPFINAEETVRAQDDHLYTFQVFLDNIRPRKQPVANLETCHQATAVGHLMNISWEVGRSVRWDGAKNRVIGDPEAQAKVLRPYRAPWKLEV